MSEAPVSIEFPRMQVDRLFAQMQRAQKELGKPLKESVKWGGILLIESLAKRTRVSKKLRRIVKNPKARKHKGDRRFAPFGVNRYDKNGKKVFQPIFRTGEYGKLRFFDTKTVSWYDRSGGSGQWRKLPSGPDVANPEIVAPGIKTDKRRKIGRSGFAKKTWQWAKQNMRTGGMANIMRVPNIASIRWSGGVDNPTVKIVNSISYMRRAMRPMQTMFNAAVEAAAREMANRIDDRIAKKLGAK